MQNKLYLLQDSTNCITISPILQSIFKSLVNSISSNVLKPYLWHMGLGHVFDNKMITLQSIILDVLNFQSNKDCLACPIAKQKRLFFFLLLIICLFLYLILYIVMFGIFLLKPHKMVSDIFFL